MSLEADTDSDGPDLEELGLWDDTDAPELDTIAEDLSPDVDADEDEGLSLEASGESDEVSEAPTDDEPQEASEEQPEEDQTDQSEEPTEPDGQSGPVLEFMGETYNTAEEASAALTEWEGKAASWEGRITKVQSELEDFQGRDREAQEWMQHAYRENQRLVARVNELESGHTPVSVNAKQAATGKLSEVVDEKTLSDLIDYAESKGADVNQVIAKYTTQKLGEAVEARFAEIEGKQAAREESVRNEQLEDRAQQELFVWGGKQVNDDGSLVYPELSSASEQYSEQFVRDAFSTWMELLKESPEFAYSAKGLKFAVQETRSRTSDGDRETRQDGPRSQTGTPLTDKVQARSRSTRKASVEAASSSNSRAGATPLTKGRGVASEDIWSQMARHAAPVVIDGEDLGFDAV